MNKIKKIVLILAVLLLSGCSATADYSIKIGNSISENLKITAYCENDCLQDEITKPRLKNYNNPGYDIYGSDYQEGFEYYKKNYSKDGNKITLEYSGNFKLEKYSNSNMAKTFFTFFNSTYRDDILTINSGNNFYFKEGLKTLNVSITTNHKVIDNNADSHSGNTYTWTINKDDPITKTIYISINTKEEQEPKKTNFILIFLIAGAFLLLLGIAGMVMYSKNEKNNKI